MDRRVRRDRQTLLRRQTDDLLVPPTHPQVLRISSGKVSLNVPASHRPRWEATACVRTGSGRVLELSTSPPVPGPPSTHHSTFGPFLGEKGRWRPVCWRLPEKLWGPVTSEALGPPRCCAPTHRNTTFSFSNHWLQGSTHTGNGTNRKVIQPTWPPAEGRVVPTGPELEGPFQGGRFKKLL